jgi:hypothetical protein
MRRGNRPRKAEKSMRSTSISRFIRGAFFKENALV